MKSISYMLVDKANSKDNQGKLAYALLNYKGDLRKLKIKEISKIAYVSNSTATKLAQSLGLSGFNELCYVFATEKDQLSNQEKMYNNELIENYMMEYNSSIVETLKIIDYDLILKLAEDISKCNYLILLSIGGTHLRASDFSYKMRRIGIVSICTSDYHQQILDAKVADEKTVALTISYSGQSKEVLEMSRYASESNAKCYSITTNDFTLKKYSKVIKISESEPQSRVITITGVNTINFILDLIFLELVKMNHDKYGTELKKTRN